MAKTVSDIILRLGVQGIEGVDRLKSAFRGLDQSLGPSQQGILELRKSITEFAKAGDRSTQSIRGQLEAFKGLRDQATIGSRAYIQLTNDIGRLTKELKALDVGLKQTEQQATQTIGQVLSQIPARKSGAFTRQISQLNQELSKYSVTSARYAEILQQIQERTSAFGRAQQRQSVISAARGVNLEAGGPALAALRIDQRLPNTTAALRLQISELAQDLENLDRTSTDYFMTQNRLADLQRELAGSNDLVAASYDRLSAAQDASTRRAKKLADIQEYYRTQGPLAPGAAGFRDPVTGAIIARGTREGIVPLRQGPVRPDNIFPVTSAAESMRLSAQRGAARQPLGARGYAQVAGAAISGGIFGGPEGLLGGVAGGALGGVGGAFAGAAIGAQVSGLRQQLAATADYAAQISKLQIALRGVAGSQGEYTRALQAAANVTRTLNIPQEVAIGGITRLSAAVKGAGGSVTDAEVVFKNVTAAIKATGGGAEDVQGAITAMVQVFSKGKVSAEELSGQLGERLPGAVTMFAEANKMSLPELQEALKKGEVGLNELMNFVEALGVRFTGTAQQIASSSADAGARLTVAFNTMKLEVGKALQPIGAEFQAAFAEFLTDITPSLIEAAKAVASGLKLILDNAKNIAAIAKFAATFALVNLAMKAFIAMNGPISTVFLALQAGFARTSQQAIVAEMRIKAAATSLRAFALAAAAPIVITVAVLGIQNLIQARQELDRIRGRKSQGGAAGIFGGTAPRESKEAAIRTIRAAQAEGRRLDSPEQIIKGLLGPLAPLVGGMETGERGLRKDVLRERVAFAKGVLRLPTRPEASAETPDLTNFKPPTGDKEGGEDKKGKSKAKGELDYTKQEAQLRLNLIAAQEKGIKLDEIKAQYALDIYEANKLSETPEKRRVAIAEAYNRATSSTTDLFSDMVDRHREMAQLDQDLNKELEDRAYKVGLLNEKDYNSILLLRERKRLEKEFEGLPGAEARVQAGVDLYRQEIDPTQFELMSQNIAKLKQEMTDLLNPVNQIVGAANAIGTAFSTSFTNVINGSQTTQEALAAFFKNLANYFLDMAAQIIQKMIVVAILNSVVGLLPGAGGQPMSSKGYFNPVTGKGVAGPNFGFAMGGVFDKGVKAYAMGGIVNKPTLFTYADGGAGRFGLMGEAGPEAILPLKRGPDGKLGVSGGSKVTVGSINISVENTGENLSPAAQKQIANQVQGIVMATLVNERRSGGVLR
jgi:tape measure domain-containing protein